jgi:hypothetical protein
MKKVIVYSILFLMSILTVYESSLVYSAFQKNNIPVYDGVTYEKHQIEQFERFNGNFSLWKKNTEFDYQMMMNGVDAGFVSLLIYSAPKWLANDYDILVRSILCLFIFTISLYSFLSYLYEKQFVRLILIFLILQLPLFYNERFGLSSYIAEIPSALLLLSGYIHVLIFFRNNKVFNLLLGLLLMSIPIFFRLNFIVYACLFMIPLVWGILKRVLKLGFINKLIFFVFSICLIGILFTYFMMYFDNFMSYYVVQEVKWEGYGDVFTAFNSFLMNFINQLGLLGLILITSILVIPKKPMFDELKFKFLPILPFILHFCIIIFVNKASNVPHVITAMTVFSILFFFSIPQIKSFEITKTRLVLFTLLIVVSGTLTLYSSIDRAKTTLPQLEASNKTVDFILNNIKLDNEFKYICLFNDVAEIPIDVAIYREKGVYLNSQEHFYYHNFGWFHKVDKGLDEYKCSNFINHKVDTKFYDLIVLNEDIDQDLLSFPLAKKVWNRATKHVYNSKKYRLIHTEKTKLYGNLLFYRPN